MFLSLDPPVEDHEASWFPQVKPLWAALELGLETTEENYQKTGAGAGT